MHREVKLIGIDLAKSIFWVRAEDVHGKALLNRKVGRARLFETVIQLKPERVAMEACGGAHYWGRRFEAAGIPVMLIPPQYVKPYRIGDKNDRNDSQAICEASRRPGLKTVRVKSVEHQDLQMLLRIRESLIQRRTQILNEARSFLLEYGFIFPAGTAKLIAGMRVSIREEKLGVALAEYIGRILEKLEDLNQEVGVYDSKLRVISRTDPVCKQLLDLAGIGPVTAVAIRSTIINASDFKNGRQLAAFLGLVPRHSSSGGKTRLLGLSKNGNRYLRQLLIHGGRSVLVRSASKTDPISQWACKKWKERGFNKACVAVANKNARMVWAVMRKSAQKQLAA